MPRALLLSMLLLPLACDKSTESPTPDAKADATKADAKDAKADDTKPKADDDHAATPAVAIADQAVVGKPAPAFTLTDLDGKSHSLSDYAGKVVVLEWFNPQCPFVKFAHSEGPLKTMAAEQMDKGIVWLSINSGGEGKQGHGEEANREGIATYGMKNPVLLDPDGAIGHTYGAEKTPHVYVINGEGTLVYRGAIDNAPFGETQGEDKVNYVEQALAQVAEGAAVANPQTAPYGCTVKYAKS